MPARRHAGPAAQADGGVGEVLHVRRGVYWRGRVDPRGWLRGGVARTCQQHSTISGGHPWSTPTSRKSSMGRLE